MQPEYGRERVSGSDVASVPWNVLAWEPPQLSLRQPLHLHIVLTQPLTGRHLSASAPDVMCEKISLV